MMASSTHHAATKRALHQMQYPRFHEAAHGLAHARGVKDTSRNGRYHNRRFARLAEEVGLDVEHHSQLGWSLTTLPQRTARRYLDAIVALERALTMRREPEQPRATRRASGRSLACLCGCGRRIRMAPSVLAAGPVVCGICGGCFAPSPAFDA
jgi:hypothetical protein